MYVEKLHLIVELPWTTLYSGVSNNCTGTIIIFWISIFTKKKIIKYDVIFYVVPKKSYVITPMIIPYCTVIRDRRVAR